MSTYLWVSSSASVGYQAAARAPLSTRCCTRSWLKHSIRQRIDLENVTASSALSILTRSLILTNHQSVALRAATQQHIPGLLHLFESYLPPSRKPVFAATSMGVFPLTSAVDVAKPVRAKAI